MNGIIYFSSPFFSVGIFVVRNCGLSHYFIVKEDRTIRKDIFGFTNDENKCE